MFISSKLRKEDISSYILYMWQMEDTIRAYGLDADRMGREYLVRFTSYSDEERKEMLSWYNDLIGMMRAENVVESGHLQIVRNAVIALTDLHAALMKSPKFPVYAAAYYKILPFIVEIRHKGAGQDKPEIESLLDMLYGSLILKMQGKSISEATQNATRQVAQFLALLNSYYQQDQEGKLEL